MFCAANVASTLANDARTARAGEAFSVAVVFAMKEFEAWLLAGVESLQGKTLAGGRGKVPENAIRPAINIEATRDSKGELKKIIHDYEQSLDQGVLAKEVRLYPVLRSCRSFRRFWSAVRELANAAKDDRPIVTPPFGP